MTTSIKSGNVLEEQCKPDSAATAVTGVSLFAGGGIGDLSLRACGIDVLSGIGIVGRPRRGLSS